MLIIFDYMFYSLAKINFNGKNAERITMSISITQSLIIVNIIVFFWGITFKTFPDIPKLLRYTILLSMFFGVDYFNRKKYKRRYSEFDLRWKNDHLLLKVIKVIGVFVLISFSWALPLLNYLLFK